VIGKVRANSTSFKLHGSCDIVNGLQRLRDLDDAPVCLPPRVEKPVKGRDFSSSARGIDVPVITSCPMIDDDKNNASRASPKSSNAPGCFEQYLSNDATIAPKRLSILSSSNDGETFVSKGASNEPSTVSLEVNNSDDIVFENRTSKFTLKPPVDTVARDSPQKNLFETLNSMVDNVSDRFGLKTESVHIINDNLDINTKIPDEADAESQRLKYEVLGDKPGYELNLVSPENDMISRDLTIPPMIRKVRVESVRRTEVDELLTDACKCRDTKRSRKRNEAGVDLSRRRPRLNNDETD